MDKPRLIYYQDAHHFHAKRLDPPVSRHKLQWPVDELLGTGVDVLAFGLGYGDVYFHDSKVGRVVGQKQDVWDSFIDWRIMRMVRDAKAMGTDQLREVIDRGRETGLRVFPSLKLQSCDRPGSDRCGLLKWDRWQEVCLGENDEHHPRYDYCYDYAHPDVQEAKLGIVREVLGDYSADGIELDFMFVPKFFRTGEEEKNAALMTSFVSRVRGIADQVGAEQGREVGVMVRVFDKRDYNLKLGLDVETWLRGKSVDAVVGQVSDQFFDTGLDAEWLAGAAKDSGAATYIRPPRRVYDERTAAPGVEMYRALGQTLHSQGVDGMYVGYLPWPFGEQEYQVLREAADPDATARRSKRYLLQPREPGLTFEEILDYSGDWTDPPRSGVPAFTDPPDRQLPLDLEAGKTARVTIRVSDDVESARNDGDIRRPVLTIRFANFCVDDEIEIRFNGATLPLGDAEITDERALTMPVRPGRSPFIAPTGMAAHWFRFRLDPELLKQGDNTVEVRVLSMAKEAGFTRSINGVEVHTRYKEFTRPVGLRVDRVSPLSG